MSEPIDINQIFRLLPHRYPFILVDKVVAYEKWDYLTAIKNVTINENFFTGHFPGNPIMPGVLMLEALAQACAILSSLSREASEGHEFIYFFAGIDNAKFKHVTYDKYLSLGYLQKRNVLWFRYIQILLQFFVALCTHAFLSKT